METPQISAAFALLIILASCSQVPPPQALPTPVGPTTITPNSETKPKTDWNVSAGRINPMDNVSTQFVSTGYIVKLILCFENGKPCGHGNAPVFVTSPCWIEADEPGRYRRTIRVKFDDNKALTERWGITDDHKGLTPPNPGAFVADLKKHKTLMVEFGCDRSDPGEVMTLLIQGLQEALDSAHLKVSSDAVAEPDSDFARRVDSTGNIREEQQIIVDGLTETWRLQWAAVPTSYCGSNEPWGCPCEGFAYGEAGDLFLIRLRNGEEIDRLHLTPFFSEGAGKAVVQRKPTDRGDLDDSGREDFPSRVNKRTTVKVMNFADYDHDGTKNEFYLQTGTIPCGKSEGVLIGLSKTSHRLHAFGTASSPGKPLHLGKWEWEALRDASGPVEVMAWTCGDHGSETQAKLLLGWTDGGIDGVQRVFSCPDNSEPVRLITEQPL